MNKTLLEAAMKRAEAELSGLQFGEVNLCLEVRDGKINRIETTRVKSCLARDLAATDEGRTMAILTGTKALTACLAAGIPLKPFYAKSPDNALESYSADPPPSGGRALQGFFARQVSSAGY